MKKKKFNLKKDYQESWEYLKSSWGYILFVFVLFFLISALVFSGMQSEELNEMVKEQLKKIVEKFEGKGAFETVVLIFANNVLASFLGIALGVFFGVITLMMIFSNAYVIGFVADLSVEKAGLGILWSLVPHGVFELPAIFISFGLGLKLGSFFISKNPWNELKKRNKHSMKVFILIVVPLLILAAVIEGLLIVLF